MTEYNRPSGLRITVPDDWSLVEQAQAPDPRTPTGRRGRFRQGPVPLPSSTTGSDPVVEALKGQELTLIDSFEIDGASSAPNRRALSAATPHVEVEVEENESAIVLVESEQLYSWQLPEPRDTEEVPAFRRGAVVTGPRRRLKFELAAKKAAPTRGSIGDYLTGRIRTYVFKFVAMLGVRAGVKFFERNIRNGWMMWDSSNWDSSWSELGSLRHLALPQNRAPRILLFVHGTFSSTQGGFGSLSRIGEGRSFLSMAKVRYDAVLGWDHSTLGMDPRENASEILAALEAGGFTIPPVIDVVAHSRGGLVARSLAEFCLPASSLKARIRRLVLVGCTNDGTQLASEENWARLIDVHTNLAVAASRATDLVLPGSIIAGEAFRGAVRSIGALLKYIAAVGTNDKVVPGLAAMRPGGPFVTELNQTQPGQPTAADSLYFAVTSNFSVQLAQQLESDQSLPRSLLAWAVDGLSDALMREPNDLVVNTASMTTVDPTAGTFLKDELEFGENPSVHHLAYFGQKEVVEALTRWFQLSPRIEERPRGLSGMASTNLTVVDAEDSAEVVISEILSEAPEYLIVRREGGRHHYAYRTQEIIDAVRSDYGGGSSPSLYEALSTHGLAMHENSSSDTEETTDIKLRPQLAGAPPMRNRIIVMDKRTPIAVLPSLEEFAAASKASALQPSPSYKGAITNFDGTAFESKGLAGRGSGGEGFGAGGSIFSPGGAEEYEPSSPTQRREGRRRRTPQSPVAAQGSATPLPQAPSASQVSSPTDHTPLYFSANMPGELRVEERVPLEVRVSTTEIREVLSGIRADDTAIVDGSRRITLEVIAKANVRLEGDSRFAFDPTSPPQLLMFDIVGVSEGTAEVWVMVRQGPAVLAHLVLQPEVVEQPNSAIAVRSATEIELSPAPPSGFPTLQIFEWRAGNDERFRFILELENGQIIDRESAPLKRSRQEYVGQLYHDIENRWVGSNKDAKHFEQEMRAYGELLLRDLVPPEIQANLWKVRDTLRAIQIRSEEPFIPWELAHLVAPTTAGEELPSRSDDTHFLAEKGLVRWLHNTGLWANQFNLRPGKVWYAIPDYPLASDKLPAAQLEIQYLVETLRGKAVVPDRDPVIQLLRKSGSIDLFHFSGHGEASTDDAIRATMMMRGRIEGNSYIPEFLPADVIATQARLRGEDGERPLIVLNACQIGRVGWRLTSIGGFADAFLRRGAGGFVGSLWSVGDPTARTFSEEFYRQLLVGKTLSESATAGRMAARKAGDPTWLAYVIYGNPHAKAVLHT